ncbi:hypothetical protein BST81_04690 [Leptolyngbya sp. 'hensonii']|uniref:hypothetical protein n=1 Tax=Leptolyngbya sp. 'hensonii' TaxID=1922337 RepID=UPI00094F5742|nr:hypothetical protein [Leptolyngbya sp. 'hensonii']OLP19565.1 hypothetical protein BST81_04690 [Leptolyngbya sp. 'hensonii']
MVTNASILRLAWSVIEESRSRELLMLNDAGLVKELLRQISRRVLLSGEEEGNLYQYISSKTALIRDLAESSLN